MAEKSLQVVLLGSNAQLPKKANASDAGYDLFASEPCIIEPWSHQLVKTGIAITVPEGTYGRIAPRSGLALKNGIHVGAGVVDRGYTGPVGIVLQNLSDKPFPVQVGDRVAQLILESIANHVQIIQVKSLGELEKPPSERGEAGFGSSGISQHLPIPNLAATATATLTDFKENDPTRKRVRPDAAEGENEPPKKENEQLEDAEEEEADRKFKRRRHNNSGGGRLTMVVGPMFACKTTCLCAFAKRYTLAKKKCLIIKYSKDTRYSIEQELITHDKLKVPASCVAEKLSDIPESLYDDSEVILIDEAHFYPDLVEFCLLATEGGKVVVAAGLVSTWDQKPFIEMCTLLAHAEEVIVLKAVCTSCGDDAIFTKRIVESKERQLIGGSDVYTARCRSCISLS